MTTTAIFAEILIIGLQASVWLALFVIWSFRVEVGRIDLSPLKDWSALITVFVVASAYTLGVAIDRLSDGLDGWADKKVREKRLPGSVRNYQKMRLRVMGLNNGVSAFIEYIRSRIRIARATVLNLVLILISAELLIAEQPDLLAGTEPWVTAVGYRRTAGALLVAAVVTSWYKLTGTYYKRIKDAYEFCVENDGSRLGDSVKKRAAAICYRRSEHGIEFLLVRTKQSRLWIFPQGKIETGKDEKASEAAAREAREEAGAVGEVRPTPLSAFSYSKTGSEKSGEIPAFLLEVEDETGKHEPGRDPTWFSPGEAKAALSGGRDVTLTEELQSVVGRACTELT